MASHGYSGSSNQDAARGAFHSDWRKESHFKDYVEPGCRVCRVAMDLEVCECADLERVTCPVAQGRFRKIFRLAYNKLRKDKAHLIPSAERLGIEEGKIAKLQLERLKMVKMIGSTEPGTEYHESCKKEKVAIDGELLRSAKLASKYARECSMHANAAVKEKEPEFDQSLMGAG